MITSTQATNAAVKAAQDVPGLIANLNALDPALGQQLTGKALLASKTVWGGIAIPVVTYVAGRFGFGWDENTCDIVAGAAIALCTIGFRAVTNSPISGLFSAPPAPPAAASAAKAGT